jgi:hypothetical protein
MAYQQPGQPQQGYPQQQQQYNNNSMQNPQMMQQQQPGQGQGQPYAGMAMGAMPGMGGGQPAGPVPMMQGHHGQPPMPGDVPPHLQQPQHQQQQQMGPAFNVDDVEDKDGCRLSWNVW